ncbi:Rieske (2Fe-2S) protein [Mycobacterium sp. 050134]|uniref:Rieske (2Fe-2S) protein n=1 Tax=Mycobacterium sp. 050134 TaxID=3096111 RepID=UPI002ED87688
MTDVSLGPVDQIPVGEGRAFVVDDRQIAVFRLRDGSLRALDASCPHRGGPLADGIADNTVVICPLHGHTYDLATGCEVANDGAPVTAYPAHAEEDGAIRLCIDARLGTG